MDRWASGFCGDVTYSEVGDPAGFDGLAEKTIDFAAEDVPLTPPQRAAVPGLVTIPEATNAIVLIYNVPGLNETLNFNGSILAQFFDGQLTNWNNSELQALNPGVVLPSATVVPYHRSDMCGSTFTLTSFFTLDNAYWAAQYNKTLRWPSNLTVGTAAAGNGGVFAGVAATVDAIGYVDLYYALSNWNTTELSFGDVENPAGHFVRASIANVTSALVDSRGSLPAGNGDWFNVSFLNSPGPSDYPIVGLSYVNVYQNLSAAYGESYGLPRALELVDFLQWAATFGQNYSASLFYAPLPSSIVNRAETTIESILYNGCPAFECSIPGVLPLFGVYASRTDLQAAFPNATNGNLASLVPLVSWASEVVTGEFPDRAFGVLAAPDIAYSYVLMGVYNDRADLRAAFPDAYTNASSYAALLWWAGQVVSGHFADDSNETLGSWGYAFDLLGVYESRPDLESAFPAAPFLLPQFTALVDWSGAVVTEAFPDSSNATLQPYGWAYALLYLYDGRSDLQAAFPDAWGNLTNFTHLVNWAGGVVTSAFSDSGSAMLGPFGYYYDLMNVYDGRSDLQSVYPNAFTNSTSYEALLVWAAGVVEQKFADSSYAMLVLYADYYETYG